MTDTWTDEGNWMAELEALNHPDVTYEQVLAYLQARHTDVEQLFSEWDFHQFTAARDWYKRFTFKKPNPHPFPSMSNMVSNINPVSNFRAKFDLWYQLFYAWAVAEGYDVSNPEAVPDKRRKRIDPAKAAGMLELERLREEVNQAKTHHQQLEKHYASRTREIQLQMITVCAERDTALLDSRTVLESKREALRKAKAAI